MSDRAVPPAGALTRGTAKASEGQWSACRGFLGAVTATVGHDMTFLGAIMHSINSDKRRGRLGASHATWQHLYPTACGACWRAVHAQRLMLPSPTGLEMTDALWTRASGYLGTPWHTKAGVFTPREVVGPWGDSTVKRR